MKKQAALVVMATIFTTLAQLSFKLGTMQPGFFLGPFLLNITIIAGFASYSMAALLFIFALRGGQLSILYPLWSLSFVWIFLVSLFVLDEPIKTLNWVGIAFIIVGISFVGRDKYA